MRKISESTPMEGLQLVNPKYQQTRYLASKEFVMVEFEVTKGEEFISVYLRPYENGKTLITAYLPELEYLEYLGDYNKSGLLKFLSKSTKLSDLYKTASKICDKPFLSKVHDFTEWKKNVDVWCIQNVVNLQLTPQIINEDYPEYELFEKKVNEIIAVVVEFLKIRLEHFLDLKDSYWVKKVSPSLVYSVIKACEKDGFWGSLFNKIDFCKDLQIREYIKENKVVLWCENKVYAIGEIIDNEEDKRHDAKAIILAEVFNDSFKDSGYFFCIDLDYEYGKWRPKANLGELVEGVSIMLNHVNTKAWAEIDKTAYKVMPEATELWYYSNPYHEGTMLHRFIEDEDKTDYDVAEPVFVVKEPEYIESSWAGVNCDDPWNDIQSFCHVSSILEESLIVISEFQRYYPIWKKKGFVGIAGEVGKFAANPFRYILKKGLGLDDNK